MVRGDFYRFETTRGHTRTGKIVRKEKDSIIVLYQADKNKRTRRILLSDIIKKNIIKEV